MSKSKEPSLRYQQFTDDWEQRKLSKEATISAGGDIDKSKLKSWGVYPVYANALSNDGIVGYYDDYYRIEAPAVTVTGRGDVGHARARRVNFTPVVRLLAVKSIHDIDFLENAINNHNVFIESTGVPQLTAPQLGDYKIYFPSLEEEGEIGLFFKQLDDTIALHQCKSNKLKQIKKSLMIQMFPKDGADTPELRIGEYSDNWKEEQLGQLVEQVKSYSLSRDVETKDSTGFRYIHYGDIHTKVADMIDIKSKLPNIKEGQYELLKKGDVVVADASEDYQGIATPAVVTTELPFKLVAGLHTIALRPKKIDSVFLYYLIHSPAFREYGYRIGTGMKVFGISAKNLLNFEGKLPSIGEQADIGNFFKHLDETIAIHQEKYEKLNQIKTALLTNMFV